MANLTAVTYLFLSVGIMIYIFLSCHGYDNAL